MKKYGILFAVAVLTLTLLTACGCTSRKVQEATLPTKVTTPTVPATSAPTVPATMPDMNTEPAPATMPEATDSVTEAATGDITDATGPMGEANTRRRGIR